MSQHQQNRNANKGNGNNKGGKTTSLPSKVSCSGCGSPKHKTGDKSCWANGKTCSNCNKEGHFPSVCPNSSSNGGGLLRDLQLSPTQMVRLPPSVRRIPLRVTLVVTLSLRLTPMSSLGVTQGESSPLVVSKALFQMRG